MAKRNRLYKNSVTYQLYLNGLNSRLDYIKQLKKKHQETGIILWINHGTSKVLEVSQTQIRRGLIRKVIMEDQKYYQLLEYLQGERKEGKKYMEWAEQFTEKEGQVFKADKRLIPRSQALKVISIFHDLLTVVYQSKDAI